MLIRIGDFEFTEVWDGVFYKKLSDYPKVTDWEIRNLLEFIDYEKKYGRSCEITCDNRATLLEVEEKLANRDRYMNVPCPKRITECTACPVRKGCETEYVCHTTSLENAMSILQSGKLLSACRARNLPAEVLQQEKRNTAKDPADYFEYIMFSWGNCQAGDRLVMERKLGRFPDEKDLSTSFTPGIRFFFHYNLLVQHPNAVFDGVLPLKVRDELILEDWLYLMVVPEAYRQQLENLIPSSLTKRCIYISNDCKDIWDWAEKVYCRVSNNHGK